MWSTFGDESADETKQRVFAVAAVWGSDEQWNQLTGKWTERTGGIPFHAKDCDSDFGDYKNKLHHENKVLYRDLAQLLAASGMWGYGYAIDLIAQLSVFPDAPDISYYKCFLEVVDRIAEVAAQEHRTVKFTFDMRPESEYNTGILYQTCIDSPFLGRHLFSEISFACRDNPRIQVADLFAREAMKALNNIVGPVKRPYRKSLLALTETGRFIVDVVQREYFESLKQQMPKLIETTGMEPEKYQQWLAESKRQHNVSNHFLYIEFLGKRDRKR